MQLEHMAVGMLHRSWQLVTPRHTRALQCLPLAQQTLLRRQQRQLLKSMLRTLLLSTMQ
jgi:hypothetical protein